ncbi:MAG: hypothetical protein JWN38_1145 [Candidatus Saccharibacteria bacterium]|nr:hypothetical protein [Candidatus Saccharibacteria bacterium]
MCVTSNPAKIRNTRTYAYATSRDGQPLHVCGYQNQAETVSAPNCMFLNFAGRNLALVREALGTKSLMLDMTKSLYALEPVVVTRGMSKSLFGGGVSVEDYGDYTVVLSQHPADILSVLESEEIPIERRVYRTPLLEEMVNFYMAYYPHDTFVLACFNGAVKPSHPITVSYTPRNPDVLTVPGLDAHDGFAPQPNAPLARDFYVAFGIEGVKLPHEVHYHDDVAGSFWAPSSVAGFRDNRYAGPNRDYVVRLDDVAAGCTGFELADALI